MAALKIYHSPRPFPALVFFFNMYRGLSRLRAFSMLINCKRPRGDFNLYTSGNVCPLILPMKTSLCYIGPTFGCISIYIYRNVVWCVCVCASQRIAK